MAGTPVDDARATVYTNEISYKKGVTEFTWTKFGGILNHLNNRRFERRQWTLNGPLTEVSLDGSDGIFVMEWPMEILYFSFGIVNPGTLGTTEIDLKWQSAPGGARSSILATTPKFTPAAPAFSYMLKDINVPAEDVVGVGGTLPVFSKTQFAKGDAITFDILQTADNSESINIEMMVRPI